MNGVDLGPLLLSFEVATVATALAAVVGIAVAALLANYRFPGRDLLDVIFTAPMVMPPTVLGYYVLVLLGRRSVLGHAYESLTGSSIVFTKTGAVVAATIGALPLVVKSVRAALEQTDPTLILAARTLGATKLRAFFSVQLPLATRGIVAALMLAFARAVGDFGVTLMVAGDIPGKTRTASLAIYGAIQAQREREATVMVVVLTALVLSLLYAVGKLTARRSEDR
jgi:molybdate transport system permease protein